MRSIACRQPTPRHPLPGFKSDQAPGSLGATCLLPCRSCFVLARSCSQASGWLWLVVGLDCPFVFSRLSGDCAPLFSVGWVVSRLQLFKPLIRLTKNLELFGLCTPTSRLRAHLYLLGSRSSSVNHPAMTETPAETRHPRIVAAAQVRQRPARGVVIGRDDVAAAAHREDVRRAFAAHQESGSGARR